MRSFTTRSSVARARAKSPHTRQWKQIGERRERQDGHLQKTRRCIERIADLCRSGVPIPRQTTIRPVILSVSRLISAAISMVSPSRQVSRQLGGELRHDAGVVVQPQAVKDGLNEAPLAGVLCAVARQQPVAEQPARAAQRSPFFEAMLVRDEHVLDVVRMIQEKCTERSNPEVRDIAVLGADLREKRQRIAPDLGKAAEERSASGSRRKHTKILPCAAKRHNSCWKPESGS